MSQVLINAIRKARQTRVTVGKYTFTARRPTVHEYLQYRTPDGKIYIPVEDLGKFVTNWDGVTGLDLASSGDGAPVPFDTVLFMEWIVDHPDIWNKILTDILAAFNRYVDQREAAAKKSDPGLSSTG